jgi:hypothetical protein
MRYRYPLALCVAAAWCGAPSFADGVADDIGVGVDVGTLGAGVIVSKPLASQWSVDASANAVTISHSYHSEGVDYGGSLHLVTAGVGVNYFPWESGAFRVRGGVYYDNTHVDFNPSIPAAGFTVNDVHYTPQQLSQLTGDLKFHSVAPYLGLGWGNVGASAGWHPTFDLGVLYQGRPKVDLRGVTGYATGSADYDAVFANVEAQRQRIRSDLGYFGWYPVATVGLQYRF